LFINIFLHSNRQPAPALRYSAGAKLPARFVSPVRLGGTIKNISLTKDNKISYDLELSKQHLISLNPIDALSKNTFAFI